MFSDAPEPISSVAGVRFLAVLACRLRDVAPACRSIFKISLRKVSIFIATLLDMNDYRQLNVSAVVGAGHRHSPVTFLERIRQFYADLTKPVCFLI